MRLLSPQFIGSFAHYASQLLVKTLRVQICWHPDMEPTNQYAYGFWHDKHFTPIMLLTKWGKGKHVGLVSASRDGEMLATWLSLLGYHVVRGSSSRKGRSGLVNLLRAVKEGYCIGIAADGPRGPRYEAKAGLSYLAVKTGLQVVPVGAAVSAKYQFKKSWDQYQLPLPFAKAVVYFGEPLTITETNDEANALIAKAINVADAKAKLILEGQTQSDVESMAKLEPLF
jgi:lysophospholipid acyltransferase (LPLAT)-like uncharacterized protein